MLKSALNEKSSISAATACDSALAFLLSRGPLFFFPQATPKSSRPGGSARGVHQTCSEIESDILETAYHLGKEKWVIQSKTTRLRNCGFDWC